MNKSFFGIMPESVRRDDLLSANAKLLFAEITSLLDDDGVCRKSNVELANVIRVSDRAIRKWLEELKKNDHIEVEMEGKKRMISLSKKAEQIFHGGTTVPHKVEQTFRVALYNIYNIYNINNTNNINNIVATPKKPTKTFDKLIVDAFDHIVELFPKNFHPKNDKKRQEWMTVIDQMNRIDKVDPRTLYILIKLIRNDPFWRDQFLSLPKLRRPNKDGIQYGQYFINRFRKELEQFYHDQKH